MKNTHQCSKCNSSDIIKVPGPASVGYSQNKVPTGFFSSGNVDRYVCLECGYSEEWITKVADLQKLRKKYGTKGGEWDEFV
ncbi:MAG: putative nucleic-acid-binding Zn-ribbon protein [Saprospiraceae bacterium]|jgi:predicted nucleic-acid-binding Zn-ribbon protein